VYQEKQNNFDCGVIALRRAQLYIQFGNKKLETSHFQSLGSIANSRIVYTDYIIRNSNFVQAESPVTPSLFGKEGEGTCSKPLTLNTIAQSTMPATTSTVDGRDEKLVALNTLPPTSMAETTNLESSPVLITKSPPMTTTMAEKKFGFSANAY
jgi:hypothetical protein